MGVGWEKSWHSNRSTVLSTFYILIIWQKRRTKNLYLNFTCWCMLFYKLQVFTTSCIFSCCQFQCLAWRGIWKIMHKYAQQNWDFAYKKILFKYYLTNVKFISIGNNCFQYKEIIALRYLLENFPVHQVFVITLDIFQIKKQELSKEYSYWKQGSVCSYKIRCHCVIQSSVFNMVNYR